MTSHIRYRLLDFMGCVGYRVGEDGSVWSKWKTRGKEGIFGAGVEGYLSNKWKQLKTKASTGKFRSYPNVLLKNMNGTRKTYQVHRLVLEAFVGPCPEGMEACHSPDHDRNNNRLSNLRWDTHKSNQKDMKMHGTVARGERQGHAKLTEDDVIDIKNLLSTKRYSRLRIAAFHGVKRVTIAGIAVGLSWKHLS